MQHRRRGDPRDDETNHRYPDIASSVRLVNRHGRPGLRGRPRPRRQGTPREVTRRERESPCEVRGRQRGNSRNGHRSRRSTRHNIRRREWGGRQPALDRNPYSMQHHFGHSVHEEIENSCRNLHPCSTKPVCSLDLSVQGSVGPQTKEISAAKPHETPESERKLPESERKLPESERKLPESETKPQESETKPQESETKIPESEATNPEASVTNIENSLSTTYISYLRQLSRSWSSSSASKLLTPDLIRYIKPRYHRCSTPLKVRILTSLLYMPATLRVDCATTLSELLTESESDRDDWVRKLSRLLQRYVQFGTVALEDLDSEMIYRIMRYIDHHQKTRPLRFKPPLEHGMIGDVVVDPVVPESLLGPTVASQLEALRNMPAPHPPQPPNFRPGGLFTDFSSPIISAAERVLRAEVRRLSSTTSAAKRTQLRHRLVGSSSPTQDGAATTTTKHQPPNNNSDRRNG